MKNKSFPEITSREALLSLIELWYQHAPRPNGYFHPAFNCAWQAVEPYKASIVSQARLLSNFAVGYELTGNSDYKKAIDAGCAYMMEALWDQELGGWFQEADAEGKTIDRNKRLYGQAFALFGLIRAWEVLGNAAILNRARETFSLIDTLFRDSCGGWYQTLDPDLTPLSEERSQNPLMHLFEALITWHNAVPDSCAADGAREISDFIIYRLLRDDGSLPELYSEQWLPLPAADGGKIDTGHQFEWAFLLSEAARLSVCDYLKQGAGLLQAGIQLGLNHSLHGVQSPVSYDGSTPAAHYGWWEQCEAARALQCWITQHNMTELRPTLNHLLEYINTACIDHTNGGWYMQPDPDSSSAQTAKGSIWKVDYHVVGMMREFLSE